MTRAVHYAPNGQVPRHPDCGVRCAYGTPGMSYSSHPSVVTCKRCLKLIGVPQPSAPATAPASPATPVERRATVAEGETTKSLSASARHLYSQLEDIQMGFEVTIELSTALDHLGDAIQDHISAIEDSRLAILERLLGEIVEATDESPHCNTSRAVAAIEAARAASGGKS